MERGYRPPRDPAPRHPDTPTPRLLTSLRCPTCSAPLDTPAHDARALTCPYCGAGVMLTDRGAAYDPAQDVHHDVIGEVLRLLRGGHRIEAVRVYRRKLGGGLKQARDAVSRIEAGQPEGSIPGRAIAASAMGCMVVVSLIALGIGFAVWRLASAPARDVARAFDIPRPPDGLPPTGDAPAEAGFAREVRRFGAEGVGAGRFEDARSVAVDAAGRVYVAEYQGGRVQVFDAAGTFVTQWMADPEMPLVSMAAGRDGTVYVVQSGDIDRYEGPTGRPLGSIGGRGRYGSVFVALDGTLWTIADRTHVVQLAPDGRRLRSFDVAAGAGARAHPNDVAVSGAGDVYVSDQFSGEIYRFDAAGRFQDRFGGRGEGAGNLRMPSGMAIDGRGRLFASDPGNGIRVFDAAGQFIDYFAGGQVVFGLAFTDSDELYAAHRNDHSVVVWRAEGE